MEASKADRKLLHSSGSLYCYHFLVLSRISSELVGLWINCRLFYFARMSIYLIIKILIVTNYVFGLLCYTFVLIRFWKFSIIYNSLVIFSVARRRDFQFPKKLLRENARNLGKGFSNIDFSSSNIKFADGTVRFPARKSI